jgi:hypothetical protein
MRGASKTFWLHGGALLPALAASLSWFCCLPLALGFLGAGAAAFGARVAPLRPYLLGLTGLLLALAFYQAYKPVACTPGTTCEVPLGRKWQRRLLWVIALLALALATVPYWASWVIYWLL